MYRGGNDRAVKGAWDKSTRRRCNQPLVRDGAGYQPIPVAWHDRRNI